MENAMDKKYFCKDKAWKLYGKRHNRSEIDIFANVAVTQNAICGIDIYFATQYNDGVRKTERTDEAPGIAGRNVGNIVVSA